MSRRESFIINGIEGGVCRLHLRPSTTDGPSLCSRTNSQKLVFKEKYWCDKVFDIEPNIAVVIDRYGESIT